MEKDITIALHIEEDGDRTHVRAELNLRGERFAATGRARRNPTDKPMPLIGEELAIARALQALTGEVMDAAQGKIDAYLTG